MNDFLPQMNNFNTQLQNSFGGTDLEPSNLPVLPIPDHRILRDPLVGNLANQLIK